VGVERLAGWGVGVGKASCWVLRQQAVVLGVSVCGSPVLPIKPAVGSVITLWRGSGWGVGGGCGCRGLRVV
jgi:hypothetical protein